MWLKQIVGDAPPQPPSEEQVDQMIQQLVNVYRQFGENGLRHFFQEQGMPDSEIDQLIEDVKQANKESE